MAARLGHRGPSAVRKEQEVEPTGVRVSTLAQPITKEQRTWAKVDREVDRAVVVETAARVFPAGPARPVTHPVAVELTHLAVAAAVAAVAVAAVARDLVRGRAVAAAAAAAAAHLGRDRSRWRVGAAVIAERVQVRRPRAAVRGRSASLGDTDAGIRRCGRARCGPNQGPMMLRPSRRARLRVDVHARNRDRLADGHLVVGLVGDEHVLPSDGASVPLVFHVSAPREVTQRL